MVDPRVAKTWMGGQAPPPRMGATALILARGTGRMKDDADALVARNRELLARAADARAQTREAVMRAEQAVQEAMRTAVTRGLTGLRGSERRTSILPRRRKVVLDHDHRASGATVLMQQR